MVMDSDSEILIFIWYRIIVLVLAYAEIFITVNLTPTGTKYTIDTEQMQHSFSRLLTSFSIVHSHVACQIEDHSTEVHNLDAQLVTVCVEATENIVPKQAVLFRWSLNSR